MVYFLIVIGRIKICNAGIFISRKIWSANGKLSRDAWVPLFKKKMEPVVVRSKEDLKAEGDRLMGISKKPRPMKDEA